MQPVEFRDGRAARGYCDRRADPDRGEVQSGRADNQLVGEREDIFQVAGYALAESSKAQVELGWYGKAGATIQGDIFGWKLIISVCPR